MTQVSKPLLALLVGTVAFFALWLVAFKPSNSSSSGSPSGLGQYQAAVNAAKNVSKVTARSAAKDGNVPTSTAAAPASTTPAAKAPATTTPAHLHSAISAAAHRHAATTAGTRPGVRTRTTTHRATHPASPIVPKRSTPSGAKQRLNVVTSAIEHDKVTAVLFYNPAGSDDRAVRNELQAVPRAHGRVVRLAVPIQELSRYTVITTQVLVSTSPTLVIIDRKHQATVITGFADGYEIAQQVDNALAVK